MGNLVGPTSGKLATIVSQDPIYVIFQASEADIIEYKQRIAASADKNPHVTIHIKLPDGTIYPHPGVTNFLDVQVEADTDTVVVRAQLPNPDGCADPRRDCRRHRADAARRNRRWWCRNPLSSSTRRATMSWWSTTRKRSSCDA